MRDELRRDERQATSRASLRRRAAVGQTPRMPGRAGRCQGQVGGGTIVLTG
jgi:hypothetical protein